LTRFKNKNLNDNGYNYENIECEICSYLDKCTYSECEEINNSNLNDYKKKNALIKNYTEVFNDEKYK